jgi:phage recombination protein Bet
MTNTTDVAVRDKPTVATYDPAAGELVIPTHIDGVSLTFSPGQRTLNDAQMELLSPLGVDAQWDPRQVAAFLMTCQTRGLDPWRREAYLMFYPDKNGGKFVHHIGIDGFRARGESTGDYRGRTTPLYCGPDGVWTEVWPHTDRPPYAAKVGILRGGFDGPVYAIALYGEYAPLMDEWVGESGNRKKTGNRVPTPTWRAAAQGGKSTVMLAKCAEAQAWRVAFPRNFAGLYAPEELEKDRPTTAVADEAAARRRAAHAAATAPAAPADVVVDAEVVPEVAEPAVPEPAPAGLGDDDARKKLLRAELVEQAEVMGRTLTAFCDRWSQSRDGRTIDTATTEELADLVRRSRPYVITALRDANRDEEADRYANAPTVGTVQELFGRGPAVPEPPAAEVEK